MSHVPAPGFRILAASTTIVKSSTGLATPTQIVANLSQDVSAMEITNFTAKTLELFSGQNGNLQHICFIPGFTSNVGSCKVERFPIVLSKGTRLSICAADDTDVTSGEVVINCWL